MPLLTKVWPRVVSVARGVVSVARGVVSVARGVLRQRCCFCFQRCVTPEVLFLFPEVYCARGGLKLVSFSCRKDGYGQSVSEFNRNQRL